MRMNRLISAAMIATLAGCATSRALAPLEKGQHGLQISFGGPFVEFGGAPIPVPFTAVGYRYGIDGRTDIHTAIYPSGAVLVGVGAWDVGVATEVLSADGGRPRIMLDLTTTWMIGDNGPGGDPAAVRFFAAPSAVFTWDIGPKDHRVYVGAEAFFQPWPSVRAIPSLMFGTELQASRAVGVQLELGWHGMHRNTLVGVPVWIGPGDQGAVSAKIGVNVRIPRKGEGRRAQRKAESAAAAEEAP